MEGLFCFCADPMIYFYSDPNYHNYQQRLAIFDLFTLEDLEVVADLYASARQHDGSGAIFIRRQRHRTCDLGPVEIYTAHDEVHVNAFENLRYRVGPLGCQLRHTIGDLLP